MRMSELILYVLLTWHNSNSPRNNAQYIERRMTFWGTIIVSQSLQTSTFIFFVCGVCAEQVITFEQKKNYICYIRNALVFVISRKQILPNPVPLIWPCRSIYNYIGTAKVARTLHIIFVNNNVFIILCED